MELEDMEDLVPTTTANIKHNLTPRQINIKPHIKNLNTYFCNSIYHVQLSTTKLHKV
jgi:hypothetical protein